MVQVDLRVASGEAPALEQPRVEAAPRLAYIDNLRWSMILLVISMHAADTYSPFGNWYFADKAATDRLTAIAFGTWQSFLQAFFMALLFAVSGYFARASLLKKGATRFVRERLVRLGAPTLLYMLVIGPVTQFYIAGSWRPAPGTPFLAEWCRHIVDGEVWSESGPLWFCVALLAFSLVYAALPRRPAAGAPARAASRPRLPTIAVFAALMALATFAVRLLIPEGRAVLNLQLGDFPQYVLMFAAGIAAHRAGWAETTPPGDGSRWLFAGLVGGLLGWALLIATGGALAGHFEAYGGGWHWQAAAKSLWESFVCVSVSLGLIGLYRRRLNHGGPLFAFLSANAFAVYVFHPPILIAVTRLLALWGGGPALAKFALAWGGGTLLSFLFAVFIARRIPGVRMIL
jgi:glucan biosynthesis protein C